MARNHRRRASRHCPCWRYQANSATFPTGVLVGSLKAGKARAVPCSWSAAGQCGSSSLADFSRKVCRCQLRPSPQQKFLTRGQGQARGKAACGAGCCCQLAAAWRNSRFFPLNMNPGREFLPSRTARLGADRGSRCAGRREGAALAGCEAVAEMGHFLRGCRSPGPGGFDRGANIWGQIYIK